MKSTKKVTELLRTSASNVIFVVTPVYEDREASFQLFKDLSKEFSSRVRLIAVDDGSVRRPLRSKEFVEGGIQGVIVRLRRNVGHQMAIAIGLGYVSQVLGNAQTTVVMDADGEDRPGTIKTLLKSLESDDVDVVVAQRRSRIETHRFKVFYLVYKIFFKLMTGRTINFGNFMALKTRAVHRMVAMQELSIHIAGAVLASKLRVYECPLDRGERYAGESRMNFVSLALHGFKGFMVFAEDVLVRVGTACAIVATLSVLGALAAVFLKIIGFSTPGWFSIALGILVLMFLQTGALTLMTLMLTGVVRSGNINTDVTYEDFIEDLELVMKDEDG